LTRAYAESILDPFKYSACIPDGRTNSSCFTIKDAGQIASGQANGACGVILGGSINAQIYKDGSQAASTATVTGNFTDLTTQPRSQYSACRLVSMAVRLTFTGNTQTDKGTIVAGQMGNGLIGGPGAAFNGRTMSQISSISQAYEQFPVRNGVIITYRPESLDDADNWQNLAASASAVTTIINTPYIYAYGFGLDATTTFEYEVVMNFEGVSQNSTYIPGGISNMSTMRSAEPGWYENAKNIVNGAMAIVPYVGSALTAMTGNPLYSTLGSVASGIRMPDRLAGFGVRSGGSRDIVQTITSLTRKKRR
jgi:hypothetical protein